MKNWFDPPYGPFQNWSAICWISLSELQFRGRQQRLIDGATSVFTDSGGEKHSWRHLSIAVVAHKTVVQRVISNRWRFNFEMADRGGQINFLRKTAMIITITKTSILIIWLVSRGFLLTYPLIPTPISLYDHIHWDWEMSSAFYLIHSTSFSSLIFRSLNWYERFSLQWSIYYWYLGIAVQIEFQ